jgi:hypothetical protein
MPQSYQMYLKEQQEFFPSQAAKRHVSFSQLELWLPRLFLGLYIAYGLGLVVAVALGRL